MPTYTPAVDRYEKFPKDWFRRCGRWGLMLPSISLGCWHNFGAPLDGWTETDWHQNCRQMLFTAFDAGITHFDLANNYGPPPGSAEERVGKILHDDLRAYRDELVISSKAGFRMQPGPYGEWGSRKYLLSSLDASLRRLRLDYVDIFYHHRPDPLNGTPIEESLAALDQAVRSGKAIYAGISNYPALSTAELMRLSDVHRLTKPIIHQPSYSMLNRWIEPDLLTATQRHGLGVICFCPLAQGLLTDKYLQGIPAGSRAATKTGFLKPQQVTEEKIAKVRKLNELAKVRGQSLAQMALAWVLRHPGVTSALIGASKPQQILENAKAIEKIAFSKEELDAIDAITK